MSRLAARTALLVAVVAAIPACGGGGSGGGGVTVLFSDSFAAFPGTTWTVTSGDPVLDAGNGNPAPCVACDTGDDEAATVSTFSTSGGVSFSAHMALIGTGAGRARWVVGSVPPVAGANASAVVDGNAGTIDYSIGATTMTVSLANDGLFHSYLFRVDFLGNAQWFRDGVLQMTQAGFPAASLNAEMRGTNGGVSPTTTALFDNVLVTTP